MFASIIRTIISVKFQINPLTVSLFSEPPPPPPYLAESQNAVGYRVRFYKSDFKITLYAAVSSR